METIRGWSTKTFLANERKTPTRHVVQEPFGENGRVADAVSTAGRQSKRRRAESKDLKGAK